MKRSVLTALCAAAALAAAADPVPVASIRWIDRDFDFGLMKEQAGPKTGSSRFVNLGPDTVSVFSVKPSCGCTSAEFSDAPVAPGDTAVVSYTYDPHMRPGKFDKSVKVRLSNGDRYSIRITGNVLGTPESLATLFPVDAGEMRLTDAVINAGEVTFGKSPVFFFNAYSMPLDSISPAVRSASPGLVVKPSKPKAGPGDIVTYSLGFDSRRHGVYGHVDIPVEFKADPASDAFPVTVGFRAFVLPDPDYLLLKQKGANPVCEPAPDIIDLGDMQGLQGDSRPIKSVVTITNAGKGPLGILRLYSNSDAIRFGKPFSTTPEPGGKATPVTVKPGKTIKVNVEIDAARLPSGPFRIPVEIITDDPAHPHLQIPVAGMK